MHQYLKRLVDERNALTGLSQQLSDQAVSDDRGLTEPEKDRLRGWQQRAAELDTEISEQNDYLGSQRSWASLQDQLTASAEALEETGRQTTAIATRQAGGIVRQSNGWGDIFTNSPAFKNYDGTGSSGRVEVPGLFERAPIDTSAVQGPPYYYAPPLWTMTTPLLDAVGRETVTTGNVEWISWPGAYPLAGEVAEGALKPEATIAPTESAAALKTYAHHKGLTRQALEDIPRIQQIVETALRGGVLRKLEEATAGALTSDATIPNVDNADLLTGIRVAIGNVQAAGYAQPNAILLNPADFAALDLTVMAATTAGPQQGSGFWGVQALPAAAIPVGTSYVGDFKTGLTLFERGAASVYMTDSHADYFLRNILVILAETRALPVVVEPLAISKVTVVAGGAAAAASTGQ